ncbi:hypothetical protein [Paramaledivibacter caminithermalis]|jgi:hypothetical protein|uniref:Uncharacterized protein n=1 Tax=Paramaledivibacter caminithermalis (strain DSM 15212 / CIP 107654 / DViRD3) TaxID=1121301 RepID=A0A1M6TRC2_PARC5|nr:hypothetical protein [Paramaledivibacter caminithermalis]SHK59486.1 hypothetical protein SAMN02745912_03770 [Paramaledivibacter caminithermalis DSM 15212]
MKQIVINTLFSCVILGLVIIGIELYRTNMTILTNAVDATDDTEKIAETDILNLNKDEVTGGDVISSIRYFKDYSNVTIRVEKKGGSTKNYTTQTYKEEIFPINYESIFDSLIEYQGEKIKKITYTEK